MMPTIDNWLTMMMTMMMTMMLAMIAMMMTKIDVIPRKTWGSWIGGQ